MVESSAPPSTSGTTEWSLPKRIAFRFAASFFLVLTLVEFSFPIAQLRAFTIGLVRWNDEIAATVSSAWSMGLDLSGYTGLLKYWEDLVAWVGTQLFGPDAPVRPHLTGSGDTLCNWLGVLTAAVLALVLVVLWSLFTRRTREPKRLAAWFWVAARFFLASVMFGYGFAKLIPNQFQPPHLGRLLEPLGEMSPMGLMWTFMGYSAGYTIFAGAGEVLGGLLLCFRRTATLGALVTMGVMTNVVAMNLCYDVPVKLYASFYLAIGAAIAMPDARRLLDVLVFARAVPARDLSLPFASRTLNVAATILTLLWIGETSYRGVTDGSIRYRSSTEGRERPALYGIWEIESFERDGVELPPLLTDEHRWRRIIIDLKEYAVVHSMSESASAFELTTDPEAKTIGLTPAAVLSRPWSIAPPMRFPGTQVDPEPEGPKPRFTFRYEEIEPGRFRFEGEFEASRLVFTAKRRTREDFLLTSRGFHWVSEDPFNR